MLASTVSDLDPWITRKAASQLVGKSIRWVIRKEKSGEIKSEKIAPACVVVRTADLAKFLLPR